ncbi:hypothetical protein AU255_16080 [Methyloprofundus sedimenti]|uniref:Type I restriction modification DNA specificity domain-containing protein n=1 Tax=Methyloprofundus sedimenti TaxID=1420851 RepID=A0A1V8M2L0_9GAMM|nr:restriction endonuclease subunit S [Methyloprofundus sedimenti]OQK15726.1 hypothetical protein AU255_16080 [Methyloprofundus sedimenti]
MDDLITKKEMLIKSKILKRAKYSGEIDEDEKRFLIPDNWVWARASDIYDIRDGTHDSPKYQDNGLPLVTSKNIYSGKLDLTNVKYISDEDHAKISERSKVDKDDILFAMIGSIGNPVIIDIDPIFSVKNVGLFKYYDRSQSVPEFLLLFLKLAAVWMKEEASGAVQSFVSLGQLRSIPIPLPPLEEQKRIVAKVDELMALCDKLEVQQQQQANNVLRANTAAINALLNPEPQQTTKSQKTSATVSVSETKASFEQNWKRIAQHFNTLYGCTLPMPDGEGRKKKHLVGLENVKALRQVITTLALMGKLVSQDKNDDTALTLLNKIALEKDKLVDNGLIKNGKPLIPIDLSEQSFDLPASWEWTRLHEIMAVVTDGDHQAPPKANTGIPFLVIGNLNQGKINRENCRFVPNEYYEKLNWSRKPTKKDILYTVTGSYGIPIMIDVSYDFCVQRHVAILKSSKSTPDQYINLVLRSKYAFDYASNIATGIAQKTVPLTGLRNMPIPIPPEAEQKRIVVKVDQLMNLCDQLEQQLTQSYSDAEKLMQATVQSLVA